MSDRFVVLIRDRHGFERTIPATDTLVLGRQSGCDVVLSDSMVSRSHVRLEWDGQTWWVEDLNSSHGTFLGEQRITRSIWEPGAVIRLADGAYTLVLVDGEHAASALNLQAILQTAQLLAGGVELDALLEQTLDRLLSISGTDRGFIMLPENGELEVWAQRNLGEDMEHDIHLSMSSVHRVFEMGEPIWIHNVSADESLMAQQSVMDLQLKTILCVPLIAQGHTIGVTYLDSRRIATGPVDRPTFEAIVGLCAVAIERARLTEENFRNQVLAKVGQVASSIVHDFKNALFVITGHAQMLSAVATDPKSEHHVNQILGAVDRLTLLSTDVLDYAKVREPKLERIDLGPWLGSLVEPLQPKISDMGALLQLAGDPCFATLDRHRFARVIENLMANSLDALKDRADRQIHITWTRRINVLELVIRDTGRGIPRKVLRHIFEPFFSYGKAKGTGLGMATVKKIVEEHGGSIEVTSEEGLGTTVTLLLPEASSTRTRNDETTGFISLHPESS